MSAALAVSAAPALAVEPGESVWVGGSIGYSGSAMHPVYHPVPADPANPGTADFFAYCIEQPRSVRTNATGVTGDYSSYVGNNFFADPAVQAKVVWVITHAYPAVSLADLGAAVGVANLSMNDAIEGAQYAIWRFTDVGADTPWQWETPASQAVYEYLVAGSTADTATTPPSTAVEVDISAPPTAGRAGSLHGPFVVSTNQPTVSISADPAYTITDASGAPVDTGAVTDGQALYLDLTEEDTAGSVALTASVDGRSGTGLVISTPLPGDTTATPAAHAQSLILVAAAGATTSATAQGSWVAAATPTIGTTLVDGADGDQNLAWDGGPVMDSVRYAGLTPGRQYTVAGELMRRSAGSGTGITGSTTFTPTSADGLVDVRFVVPEGYAGESLVAFEYLYEGPTATGSPVAEHADIEDAAQTVAVERQPERPATSAPQAGGRTSVGPEALAATGGELPGPVIITALSAMIAGAMLMLARRRARGNV